MSKTIFLGKNGETFGPFSESDINELRTSGKIFEYSWIRNENEANWRPLDAPPPPSMDVGAQSSPNPVEETIKVETKTKKKTVSKSLPKEIQAICHNNHQIMSGTLKDITDEGCYFIASGNSTEPKMGTQSLVILNLLDEKSGKSLNVKAQILDTKRSTEGWAYKIFWENCPTL